jgi:drug/metabolite transporter (DMT)-like permease
MYLSILGVVLLSREPAAAAAKPPATPAHAPPPRFRGEGVIMIFLAAFTEALIYFVVREIKTPNNWNHLFLSYFFGAVAFTTFYFGEISKITWESTLSFSMMVNIVIGLIGYLLRFFAISRLDAAIYAPLSYFGILMSYVYGVLINGESITWQKIIGTLCILIPNYVLLPRAVTGAA